MARGPGRADSRHRAQRRRAGRPHPSTGRRPTFGPYITRVLLDNVVKRKVLVRRNSKVVEILQRPDGAMRGVVVQDRRGGLYTIETPAIVIASGGYGSNPKRVAELRPDLANFTSTASRAPRATPSTWQAGSARKSSISTRSRSTRPRRWGEDADQRDGAGCGSHPGEPRWQALRERSHDARQGVGRGSRAEGQDRVPRFSTRA